MRFIAGLGAAALGAVTALLPVAPAQADPVRDDQRALMKTLDLANAWKTSKGAGVTVAVVDSGVNPGQADLKGAVTSGPNLLSFLDGSTPPKRLHGTGMASLIAGRGHGPGGRDGVIGVAPRSRILAVRAIAEKEDSSYPRYRQSERAADAVAKGIRYAADHGADVINLSLGDYGRNPEEREAIGYAVGKGVVIVAAAGNDGDRARRRTADGLTQFAYPASYPGVIAVAATSPDHGRAEFSNRNYSVLVAAPGDDVVTAGPNGEYYIGSGTSQASAVVSGIAALIRSRHPKLPPALVSQALVAGAKNGASGDYDAELGFGEVNAAKALAAAATLTTQGTGARAGQSAGQRFTEAAPEPVTVIEHPVWVKPVIGVVIVGGVAGTVAALVIAVLLARRGGRDEPLPGQHAVPPAG